MPALIRFDENSPLILFQLKSHEWQMIVTHGLSTSGAGYAG
jgi:hypothetical protein